MCEYLDLPSAASDRQLLHGVSQAAKVYYNYTGSASCLNTSQTATSSLGFLGWYYQVGRTPSCSFQHHEIFTIAVTFLSEPSSSVLH